MALTGTKSPGRTKLPLLVNVPLAGIETICTARKAFGGVSFGSVNPKSVVPNVYTASSSRLTVLGVPGGGSFTFVTLIVTVFGERSVSPPKLAVPPSSFTWNVNVVYGEP